MKNSNLIKTIDIVPKETNTVPNSTATIPIWQSWIQMSVNFLGNAMQQGAVVLFDQAIVSLTNFLTGVIIGRACTKDEFGLYMLCFSIVVIVIDIQNALITSPYTVLRHRLHSDMQSSYAGSTLIHQFILSVAVIVALVIGGIVLSVYFDFQNLAVVVRTLGMVILFILLREYCRHVCFARFLFRTAFVVDLCVAFIQLSVLLFLSFFGWLSARNALCVIGISSFIVATIWLITERNIFACRFTNSLKDFKYNWSFGKWMFAGRTVLLLSTQIYPWLLTVFSGVATAGVFAACWTIAIMINPFLVALQNYLGPKMAHAFTRGISDLNQLVIKASFFIAVTLGLFCLIIFKFGGQLVVLVYGNNYADNGFLVSVLSISIFTSAIVSPLAYGIWAMVRPDLNFKINLIFVIITFTLGIYLIDSFGMLGAAFGLLSSNIGTSAVRLIIFKKLVHSVSGKSIYNE